jgi:methylated-DNA-[protein]-cysteine S-methyltransferase
VVKYVARNYIIYVISADVRRVLKKKLINFKLPLATVCHSYALDSQLQIRDKVDKRAMSNPWDNSQFNSWGNSLNNFWMKYSSPIGILKLYFANASLCRVDLPELSVPENPPSESSFASEPYFASTSRPNAVISRPYPYTAEIKQAIKQLDAYFKHPHSDWQQIRIVYGGSAHQQRVWQALQKIPLGQTVTYGKLAKQLGSCAQAIGQACRRNPLPIIIPCHRVVAQNDLGGYSGNKTGALLAAKEWLLNHEFLQS